MRTRRVKIEKPDTPEEISFQIKSPTKKSRSKPKNLKTPKTEKSKPGRKNSLLEKYIYNTESRDVQHEIDRITMLEHRSLSIKRTRQILTEVRVTGGRGGSEAGPKHGRPAGGLWHDILEKIIGGPYQNKKIEKKKFEKILIFQNKSS